MLPAHLSALVDLRPVFHPETRELQLWDVYVRGEWLGSRRTLAQCRDLLRWALR